MNRHPGRERGIALIEALVAFAVMAFGMLAMIGLQSTLRFNGDIARQRSEATRLAQEQLDTLRSYASIASAAGVRAWDDLGDDAGDVGDFTLTNTAYRRVTTVARLTAPERAAVSVDVSWLDRRGDRQAVVLRSLVTGVEPTLSGSLALAAAAPRRAPRGASLDVPIDAHDLGNGRSIVKPDPTGTVAWVFDPASGIVDSRCSVPAGVALAALSVADLTGCTALRARYVAGHVRFDTDGSVDAADAELPAGASMDLGMALHDTRGLDPTLPYECLAVRGAQAVRFSCLVHAPGDRWSGRLDVVPVGWTLSALATGFRVCRYTADTDRDGVTDNLEHPLAYVDVQGSLTQQNFLVVRGDNACPADRPADPLHGDLVDSSTREQAPTPVS